MLLVDKSSYIPVELHQIRRVLPALYEGLWACDLGQPEHQTEGDYIKDTTIALDSCEVSLWILYDTIQSSCKVVPATPGSSEATSLDGLASLAAANRLIKQIHAALSSLTRRRHPGSSRKPRAHGKENIPQERSASSQAWKYVCTGTGGQYNTVQEGSGYQTITNAHKIHDNAKTHVPRMDQL